MILFEHFEVLLRQSDKLDISVLVLAEFEGYILPGALELHKSLLHLGLLSGLVGDFFNIFNVLVKVEVVDVSKKKLLVNGEVLLHLLLQ